MLHSFLNQSPRQASNPTIGIAFFSRSFEVMDKKYALQVWDTAGQERYRCITPLYYRDADGVLLVCDLTEKNSLFGLQDIIKFMKEYAPPQICNLEYSNSKPAASSETKWISKISSRSQRTN